MIATKSRAGRRLLCRHLLATAVLGTLGLAGATSPALAQNRVSAVSVVTIVDHPSLDALRDGLHDELNAAGYQDGKNLKWSFQSAQGNTATAAQIARKFVGDRPDVIVPITTPAAQAVVAATQDIPVVYNAITDPVAARIIKSMGPSGTNVTGVSDRLDAERQVGLIRQVVPHVKAVGMVYSPAEANSVSAMRDLKAALDKHGIRLIEASAPRSVDVGQAARRLVGKVDVIYSGNDNNVIAAYEALIKVGNDAKIPLIAADRSSVQRGATAALAIDYYAMGRQTGRMVLRILKGEKPGDMPSETTDRLELTLNLDAARKQGVTLSEALRKEAKEVFGK